MEYTVKQGDCIESIAFRHGFFWQALWDHPNNKNLKQLRKDPNVLLKGDVVFIPDKHLKQESCATDQRHRFKKKGVPSKLEIVFKDKENKPRKAVPYVLDLDGVLITGKTGDDGSVKHSLSPKLKKAKITVGEGVEQVQYDLHIGAVDPIDQVSGVQERLYNLGIYHGAINNEMDGQTRQAIREFQGNNQLQETGELDDKTKQELKKQHGS